MDTVTPRSEGLSPGQYVRYVEKNEVDADGNGRHTVSSQITLPGADLGPTHVRTYDPDSSTSSAAFGSGHPHASAAAAATSGARRSIVAAQLPAAATAMPISNGTATSQILRSGGPRTAPQTGSPPLPPPDAQGASFLPRGWGAPIRLAPRGAAPPPPH